jgi:hypothetical protein
MGSSRSSNPRPDVRSVTVAVTSLVMENHGLTISGDAGMLRSMSAKPAASIAWMPSGPTIAYAMPGTESSTGIGELENPGVVVLIWILSEL